MQRKGREELQSIRSISTPTPMVNSANPIPEIFCSIYLSRKPTELFAEPVRRE
jgi:hypothetical protein